MIGRILRLGLAEVTRVTRQRLFFGILLAEILVCVGIALFQRAAATEDPDAPTTAFRCFLEILRHSSLFLALGTFLLASLAVAQEISARTIQNLILCPVRRFEIVLGKILAHGAIAIVLLGVVASVALAISGFLYDFRAVETDGILLAGRADMAKDAVIGLLLTLPALAAWTLFGLALSTVFRQLAPALAAAGFAYFGLVGIGFAFGDVPLSNLFFSHYTGRFLQLASDMTQGFSDAYWDPDEILRGVVVPVVTGGVFAILSLVTFQRAELRG